MSLKKTPKKSCDICKKKSPLTKKPEVDKNFSKDIKWDRQNKLWVTDCKAYAPGTKCKKLRPEKFKACPGDIWVCDSCRRFPNENYDGARPTFDTCWVKFWADVMVKRDEYINECIKIFKTSMNDDG